MVVQHNVTAINSNRMLGITTSGQAKSTEKLSSGYKINRAADDAAGLSISEKMRKQMRGLDQASTNAEDGISTVQTAEGALTEVHDMLQRMNELAVQAANGTNSLSDREAIQNEIDQLTTEIDRVSQTTKFNETYLLEGNGAATLQTVNAHDAGLEGELVQSLTQGTFTMEVQKAGDVYKVAGVEYNIGMNSSAAQVLVESAYNSNNTITIDGTTYTVVSSDNAADPSTYKLTSTNLKALITSGSVVGFKNATYHTYSAYDTTTISATALYNKVKEELKTASSIGADSDYLASVALTGSSIATTNGVTTSSMIFTIEKAKVQTVEPLSLSLHVGSDADMTNKITVEIDSLDAAGLGIKSLNVKDGTGIAATYAIDAIEDAIQHVSLQRSALGAIQNRLEHTIKNLDNVVENTTAAESRIRDTDMAEEMVEYSKNNILAQAGQSMLAQANQSTQGVLSLLQG